MPRVLTVQLHDGSHVEMKVADDLTLEELGTDLQGFIHFTGNNGDTLISHKNNIAAIQITKISG